MLANNAIKIKPKTETSTKEWHLDRQGQMYAIMFLTAASMIPIYFFLGVQISEGQTPEWLWLAEASAWAIRALVEAWALIYLFQTVADNKRSEWVLIIFEAALIILTCIVIGLTIFSARNGQSIDTLSPVLFAVWSGSVAAFAPLMLGAVGYAYKHHREPVDQDLVEAVNRLEREAENLETDNALLRDDYKALLSDKEKLTSSHKALAANYATIESLRKWAVIEALSEESDLADKRKAAVMLSEQFGGLSFTQIAAMCHTNRQNVSKWLGGGK